MKGTPSCRCKSLILSFREKQHLLFSDHYTLITTCLQILYSVFDNRSWLFLHSVPLTLEDKHFISLTQTHSITLSAHHILYFRSELRCSYCLQHMSKKSQHEKLLFIFHKGTITYPVNWHALKWHLLTPVCKIGDILFLSLLLFAHHFENHPWPHAATEGSVSTLDHPQ